MEEDIRQYARLGLCHHMLYPSCTENFDYQLETLASLARRPDIETFDCFVPYGEQHRTKLIELFGKCGKENITFAIHLFPFKQISLADPAAAIQGLIRVVLDDIIEQVAVAGGNGLIVPSGRPKPQDATQAHYETFADFCRWLCSRCAPHGITAMLEPFDTDIDKCFLYGSTAECVKLIESLMPEVDNFGIELDVAHLPLMNETFADAIRTVAPHLRRVHLGNCVLKNREHSLYGDKHPPIGFPGGEIDTPQLAEILRCLLEVGYLNSRHRGDLILEMIPWPGRSVEDTITDGIARVEAAWQML
ncbi:MAG: TIM barrel protein [Pirellulales bacterium]|nr:TIM barrel protein [Pirellulales bacterium]